MYVVSFLCACTGKLRPSNKFWIWHIMMQYLHTAILPFPFPVVDDTYCISYRDMYASGNRSSLLPWRVYFYTLLYHNLWSSSPPHQAGPCHGHCYANNMPIFMSSVFCPRTCISIYILCMFSQKQNRKLDSLNSIHRVTSVLCLPIRFTWVTVCNIGSCSSTDGIPNRSCSGNPCRLAGIANVWLDHKCHTQGCTFVSVRWKLALDY